MSDYMDKAKKMGAYAADKVGDAAKIGKYKASIASQKSEINDNKRKIGEYCYSKYVAGEELDATIQDFCHIIEDCNDTISKYEVKIAKVRAGED